LRALIVLAHPEPSSFNAQLAKLATTQLQEMGYEIEHSNLYAMRFDPSEGPHHYAPDLFDGPFDAQAHQRRASDLNRLPEIIQHELDKLEKCDLLILQYPMWWFAAPAILKGWIDRVFVYGRTYTGKKRYDRGLFKGKRAMLSVTFGGPEPTFAHNGRNGDIDLLLWPMNMNFHYLGYSVLPPFTAFGVEGGLKYSAPEVLVARLQAYKELYRQHLTSLPNMNPVPFNGWDDWDENGRLKPGITGYSLFMRGSK